MLALPPFFTPFFLALRNIRARRWRTLLTMLGIVLGVAVVLAIQLTNETTLQSLRQVFDRATGQASLLVLPENREGKTLSQDLLDSLLRMKGMQAAAPTIRVQTLPAGRSESWQIAFSMTGIASGNVFTLYGVDPVVDPQVRVYQLSAGRMPNPNQNEVLVPQKYADEERLRLGNYLEVLVPGGAARLRIVGLLADEGVALLNDGQVGFAPLKIVQELFERRGELDEIALRIDPEISEQPRSLETLKQRLERLVGEEGEVVYPGGRGELVSQMLATYQFGLTFFSIISIFVGAFLIYNTFSMTIVERTREIGMLRAIGMSRLGILRSVLAEALLLSLVGSALGLVAGFALARGLVNILGDVVTSTDPNALSVPARSLVQSLGVGIGVALLASLAPALRAAQVSPLEAMRARSRSRERIASSVWQAGLLLIAAGWIMIYQISWPQAIASRVGSAAILMVLLGATLTIPLAAPHLERVTRRIAARFFGNEGAIGSANIRRAVGRTSLTVASLLVSLTMIISIDSLAYSFEADITGWIDSVLGGDLYVRSAVPMRESFAGQLKNVPGVAVVTPTRVFRVRVAKDSLPPGVAEDWFYFNALDPATFRQVAEMEFAANQGDTNQIWSRFARGGSIFISNIVAERYQLKQGDTIYLVTRRGIRAFNVAAEVLDFTGQSGLVYGSYADMHAWFAEQGADRFTLKVAPGYAIPEVAQKIEARYKERRHISIQTTQDFKESILDLVNEAFRLFDVLSLIGMIIGGLGVVNTLTMNVIERQQEIGGLRSLGMTRRQVVRMVLAEAMAMGAMGTVYGLACGYFLSLVLVRGMNQMVGYDLTYAFTPQPFLIGILIATGATQLAALYPARRAAGVNIVEAIKHE